MIIFRLVLYSMSFVCAILGTFFCRETKANRKAPHNHGNDNTSSQRKEAKAKKTKAIISFISATCGILLGFALPIPAPVVYPSDCEFSHPSPYEIRLEADSLTRIYYTLNGDSSPKKDGILYEQPIILEDNTTIVAQSKFLIWWSAQTKVNCPVYKADEHEEVIEATRLDFLEKDIEMQVGDTYKINTIISPENAIPPIMEWSSDNADVVTVISDGTITAKSAGSAVITAKISILNLSAHCNIIVRENNSNDTLPVINENIINSHPAEQGPSPSEQKSSSQPDETAAPPIILTGISIQSAPFQNTYYCGESLNTDGLELTAHYSNGTSQTIQRGYKCSPPILNTVGSQTITVTYGGQKAFFTVSVKESKTETVILESIEIKSLPLKTIYEIGEYLDTAGLILTAWYNDGSSKTIQDHYDCSPRHLITAGSQNITVEYENLTTSYVVSVQDVKQQPVTLNSIAIKRLPDKKYYYVGDFLDITGLELTGNQSDGTSQTITEGFSWIPKTLAEPGYQTITVLYNGKTTNFTVSVEEITVTDIAIKSLPHKTEYKIGERLNMNGLELTVQYNNGTSQNISSDFNYPQTELTTAGQQTIMVEYSGKSTSFTINVIADPIRITSCELYKRYESDNILQSMFTVNFSTNVDYKKATFYIGGYSVNCLLTDASEGMQSFDRNYFTNSSYDIELAVVDAYGNTDTHKFKADLGEIAISLEQQSLELSVNNTCTLTAYVTGIAGHDVKWSSSDSDIVSVSNDGVLGKPYASAKLTAKKAGSVTVTAAVGGKSVECVVNVK